MATCCRAPSACASCSSISLQCSSASAARPKAAVSAWYSWRSAAHWTSRPAPSSRFSSTSRSRCPRPPPRLQPLPTRPPLHRHNRAKCSRRYTSRRTCTRTRSKRSVRVPSLSCASSGDSDSHSRRQSSSGPRGGGCAEWERRWVNWSACRTSGIGVRRRLASSSSPTRTCRRFDDEIELFILWS